MRMEESNEVRVKNEPIFDSQSISQTREATSGNNQQKKITIRSNNERSIKQESQPISISNSKRTREDYSSDDKEQPNKRKRQSILVKEEPIDNQIQTFKPQIEVKAEEKFSETEEFANKISAAFLNEETTKATTSK